MAGTATAKVRSFRYYDAKEASDDQALDYARTLYIYENCTNALELARRVGRPVATVQRWMGDGFWLDKRRQHVRAQYGAIQKKIGKPEHMPLLAAKNALKGLKLLDKMLEQQPSLAQLKQMADINDTFNVTTDRIQKQLKYTGDILKRKDGGQADIANITKVEGYLSPAVKLAK